MPQLWVLVSVSMFCFLSASSGRTASSEFFQRDYTELYQAPGRWSQINGIYIYVYIHKYTYIYIYIIDDHVLVWPESGPRCLDGQKVGALAPKAFNVVLVDALGIPKRIFFGAPLAGSILRTLIFFGRPAVIRWVLEVVQLSICPSHLVQAVFIIFHSVTAHAKSWQDES